MSNPHLALAPVFKRFREHRLSEGARGEFYEVHRCFIQAARDQGVLKTVQDAAVLIEEVVPSTFWREISDRHAETFDTLRRVMSDGPRTFIDDAIACLLAGRAADALRLLGKIHEKKIENFAKYRALVEKGPDRGLAIFQVVNPFYYLWSAMPVTRDPVSHGWRSKQFDSARSDPAKIVAKDIENNEHILITMLRKELGSTFWENARVLDCGCGDGRTANLLMRHLGVNPRNYRGFDLQIGRRDATRRVLESWIDSSTGSNNFEENSVFILDALKEPTDNQIKLLSEVDLFLLASFTNVFSDEELHHVLQNLLIDRPAFIIDVSVITSWTLCVGRSDLTPFYGERGYQLRASQMEMPHLAADDAHRLWMPERYWSNRCIFIYERAPV